MPQSLFPQGTKLPDETVLGRVLTGRDDRFWIHAARDGRRVLLMTSEFASSLNRGMQVLTVPELSNFSFGSVEYRFLVASGALDLVERLPRPRTREEAMLLAPALAPMPTPLSGLIYCEAHESVFAFHDEALPGRSKAVVLGGYLSGGVDVSAEDIIALQRIVPTIDLEDLEQIVLDAGVRPKSPVSPSKRSRAGRPAAPRPAGEGGRLGQFVLPGRQALSDFFNEHVVDIVDDERSHVFTGPRNGGRRHVPPLHARPSGRLCASSSAVLGG